MIPPPSDEGELHLIEEGEELVVYRAVASADRTSDELVDSLRSNAELGKPPRLWEKTHPLIHAGISTWDDAETAAATARKFPSQGGFVAEIRLDPESGGQYFRWGSARHLTVWGDALMILERIVDIFPV